MDIRAIEQNLKEYFKEKKEVRFCLLYGSAAMGRLGPISDLDVAVYLSEDLGKDEMGERLIEFTCDLMRLCRMNNVDVTILNLASPFLTYQVFKYGTLLKSSSRDELCGFKAKALGRYQDIRPMYELYSNVAIERLSRGGRG